MKATLKNILGKPMLFADKPLYLTNAFSRLLWDTFYSKFDWRVVVNSDQELERASDWFTSELTTGLEDGQVALERSPNHPHLIFKLK